MTAVSPFKGLASFEDSELDGLLFFGREREREIIAANLMASRLTVLYGETGVGKSSVLRAGVVRDLRALPEPLEVVVFDDWQDDPAALLRAQLSAAVGAEPGGSLAETLELCAALAGGEVFVLLDAVEEYFLYHGVGKDPDEFLEDFARAVAWPGLRANFLLSIREDALAKLDRFKGRIPNVLGNYLRLDHLDRASAREAIVGPIDRFNGLSADEAVEIEPDLVEAVLDQVAAGRVELGESGRGGVDDISRARIEAPFLQLVMTRLWETEHAAGSRVLRVATLVELGGAEQIVRDHLDDALAALTQDEQDVAASMFNQLVTPSGAKIAHDAADLAGYVGADQADVEPVLASLSAQRILRPVPGVPGFDRPRYEIFHDILAEGVLAWRTRHESARTLAEVHEAAARRHRRLLGVAIAALLLAGAMAIVTIFAFSQRSEAEAQAKKAHARAFEASALTQLSVDPELSVSLTARAAELDPGDHAADVLRRALLASRLRGVVHTHGPAVAAHFSPDGTQFLVAGGTKARVYASRIGNHRPLITLDHKGLVTAADYSPDGSVIFTAGVDGRVQLWSAVDGHPLRVLRNGAAVRTVHFDASGASVVIAGGRVVNVWRVRDGRRLFTHRFGWPVTGARLTSDGALLAVGGNNPVALVYEVAAGNRLHRFDQAPFLKGSQRNFVKDLAFSPDDRLLATGGRMGGVVVWDVRSGRYRRTLPHKAGVLAIAFSPDGSALGTASADGVGRIWDVASGRPRVALIGHTHFVVAIAFSPDGQYVVTSSSDGTARVWSIGGERWALLAGDSDTVRQASFSRDGRLVLSASDDGTARLWDPQTQPKLHTLATEKGPLLELVNLGRGRVLTAGPGDEALVLRASDGGLVRRLRVLGRVVAVAANARGTLIAVAAGKTTTLFDLTTGKLRRVVHQRADVDAVGLSPRGDLLATGGADSLARIWNLAGDPKPPRLLKGHAKAITSIAFSPDGNRVATASRDETARIWDVSGRRLRTLAQDTNEMTSVDFSPSGGEALTASKDADARLWDTQTGVREQLLRWHFGAIGDAAFSPDGDWIATAGPVTLQLWEPHSQVRGPLFLLGVASRGGITGVAFDSSSQRVLAVSKSGKVLAFRCGICRGLDDLRRLAAKRLALTGRNLTPAESKQYGG